MKNDWLVQRRQRHKLERLLARRPDEPGTFEYAGYWDYGGDDDTIPILKRSVHDNVITNVKQKSGSGLSAASKTAEWAQHIHENPTVEM